VNYTLLDLNLLSLVTLSALLVLISFITLVLGWWQINIFRGKAMDNPDGSRDDWHEQKIFYGISFADLIIICPITFAGIVLILLQSYWGFFILGLVSFWHVWVNTVTTVTSLRFETPKITLNWFIVFPFGILVGLAYLIWVVMHFNLVFLS